MSGQSAKRAAPPAKPHFARRFFDLAGGYWSGEQKWSVRFLSVALVVLTIGQVVEPVMFNLWSQRLFDSLEQRDMQRFLTVAAMIAGIILFNITVQMLHLRVKRRLQFGWRNWLSRRVAEDWLSKGRHYQLNSMPGDHSNPDGRIAEDVRITTEYAVDLTHSLMYCVILLFSFTSILWTLSGTLETRLAGLSLHIPGYLLYVAVFYAAMGTSIALLLGRPLVRAVNRRQGLEADYRFGLVRIREHAQAIALLHAETEERRHLFSLLRGVRAGWTGQTRALSIVTVFSAGYSVLCAAFPILISAPRYISGAISLGGLMQTAQAFQQTVAALSWPVDNLGRAAEWKASAERVLGLEESVMRLQEEARIDGLRRIEVERSAGALTLAFDRLSIDDVSGQTLVAPFSAEIHPGERVLIVGDPVAAITLFRAVARVWPWGRGRIVLPAHRRVFIMPQRPYLPLGSLRRALGYPGPDNLLESQGLAALERVGLDYLAPRLGDHDDWEAVLAPAEQQRLGFARLLVRRPDWIFIENATDALDHGAESEMHRLLETEFRDATILTISNRAALDGFPGRKFLLERGDRVVTVREVTDLPDLTAQGEASETL